MLANIRRAIGLRTRIHRIKYPLPDYVNQLHHKFSSHPEGQHTVGERDAAVIYNMVRRNRPEHIIDLGLGIGASATVAAAAMNENGVGKITAVEQHEWIANLAVDLIPKELIKRIEIKVCTTEVRSYRGDDWSCYQYTPESKDIDMVIVDGPAEWMGDDGNIIQLANGDLLGFMSFLNTNSYVFVDQRWDTVAAYRRHLKNNFVINSDKRYNHSILRLVDPDV
jgi:hypothetical protein